MLRAVPSIMALALLVVLAPFAHAATLRVASAEDVSLDGTLAVRLAGGSGVITSLRGSGQFVFTGAAGEMRVWTWERTTTAVYAFPARDLQQEVVPLANATLRLVAADERFGLRIVAAEDAYVEAAGRVAGAGQPSRLARDVHQTVYLDPAAGALPSPEWVRVDWRAGWQHVGTQLADDSPAPSFPLPADAQVGLHGRVLVQLVGGNLTVRDADGAERTLRLGEWAEEDSGVPGVRHVTRRHVILDATLAGADLPAGPAWGFAAPRAAWRLDGEARWTRASGEADVHGERRAFHGADVALDAAAVLVPGDAAGLGVPGPQAYAADGDFRALRIDGATVAAPASSSLAAPAASLTLGALVLLLVTKAGQALLAAGAASLYTRLGPGDVLRHPQRQRIRDVVTAEPGIHQRELHRRVGGAWGPFAFHLRMLAKAGHVRVVRQGAYTLVFPAGSAAAAAIAIPHPVARAVFEAVPADGSPIFLTDLVAAVGVSRELVGYHLRTLEARGLLRRVELAGSRRGVARVLPQAPSASA